MSLTNAETNTELPQPQLSESLNMTRVEVAKGAVSSGESHQSETIILVLEGEWRFHLAGREATLKKDGVLRIAAHEPYSSEALADTIALKIAPIRHHGCGNVAPSHEDPDQYLWGV
jgi:quercetin dioxygenase-like cupin family protein